MAGAGRYNQPRDFGHDDDNSDNSDVGDDGNVRDNSSGRHHQPEESGHDRADTSALGIVDAANSSDLDLRSDLSLPQQGAVQLRSPQEETGYAQLTDETLQSVNQCRNLTQAEYGAFATTLRIAPDRRPIQPGGQGDYQAGQMVRSALGCGRGIRDIIQALIHPNCCRGDIAGLLLCDYRRMRGLQDIRRQRALRDVPFLTRRIDSMGFRARNDLIQRLSLKREDGNDWRGVADGLGIPCVPLIQLWEQQTRPLPAESLLNHWQIERNATVGVLCCVLVFLGREDLVQIICDFDDSNWNF